MSQYEELIETLLQIRSSPIPHHEEGAKVQVIVPIMKAVGWDPFSPHDVAYEYPIERDRVDIALMGPEGDTVALIEAKGPRQVDLDPHVPQLVGYAFREGVDICILSNSTEWWFYLPMEKIPFKKRRFAVLNVRTGPVEQLAEDFMTFLGKGNLIGGHAEQQAKRVLQARLDHRRLMREMPEVWQKMLTEPDEQLVELLGRRVYEQISLRPTKEQVLAALSHRPVPPPPNGIDPPVSTDGGGFSDGDLVFLEDNLAAMGMHGRRFELWGKSYEVSGWSELLVKVAELLHERHPADFDRILEVHGSNNRVPMATRDPELLARKRQVGDTGIYLNVGLPARSFHWRAHKFIEHFGYPRDALSIWGKPV